MIRKYKLIGYILLVFVIAFSGFVVGVVYAVNNIELIDKVLEADNNIHTIKYIRQNKLDTAVKLQMQTLDVNIATINDIDENGGKILYLPQRGIAYIRFMRSMKAIKDYKNEKQCIKNKYESLKSEIK